VLLICTHYIVRCIERMVTIQLSSYVGATDGLTNIYYRNVFNVYEVTSSGLTHAWVIHLSDDAADG
jgi:hypothetical protein